MTRSFALLSSLVLLALPALGQVDYSLRFEPGGSRWQIEARLPGRGEQQLDFRIPSWTPGAYHPANFGRFVREIAASDQSGTELAIEQVSDGRFVLRGTAQAKEIVIRYEADSISTSVFSNNIIDVESNRIAEDYAYVTPVSLFGFVPERSQERVSLAVALPQDWSTATVLERDEQGRFLAPSYFRFEDSPLFFSPTLENADFQVDGKPHRVSVHGRTREETETIAAGCKRIAEAGSRLLGGLPYDRYHFLFGFVPEGGGSGLEHSFSTLILVPPQIGLGEDDGLWGLTAHEYFHLWCAERIHVAAIHNPDLSEPIETGTIWVNEGITEYFCRHLLLHAGFLEEQELLEGYLENPIPPGMLPKQAWTAVSRATVSWSGMQDLMMFAARMYVLGPPTIFALDMTMRRETEGERGVFDLLRHLITNYVEQDRGFEEDELDDILGAIAGPQAVAFYERYIDGDEVPDPAQYLDVIGYRSEQGRVVPLEEISAAQERARSDYFSESGKPL